MQQAVEPKPGAVQRALPAELSDRVWPARSWARARRETRSSGHALLDAELPGGGWPCGAVTEVLQPQAGLLEWRLLGPVCRTLAAEGRRVVLIGPPQVPHLPGLAHAGITPASLVWVRAQTQAERLWSAEQLLRAQVPSVIILWLSEVRPAQMRRLQVGAQAGDAWVFACRPWAARQESSAAPLRLQARVDLDWALKVQLFKRQGPVHEGELTLPSVPGGLAAALPARLWRPSEWLADRRETEHAQAATRARRAGATGDRPVGGPVVSRTARGTV